MIKKSEKKSKIKVNKLKEIETEIKDLTDKEAQKIKGGLTGSRSQSDAQKSVANNLSV